jgi:dual specificity phosphatase 3
MTHTMEEEFKAILHRKQPVNYDWVLDDLATGGDLHWQHEKAVEQIEQVVEDGITHIIDMRMEWSDEDLVREYAPDIQYLNIKTDDDFGYHIPQSAFDEGVEFARQAVAADGKVLAHCHMGINRGPSMAMAILLDRGWSPIKAFDHIRKQRSVCAIGYAEDALLAHLLREAMDSASVVLDNFDRHVKRKMTQNEMNRINGIIRGLRAEEGTEFR